MQRNVSRRTRIFVTANRHENCLKLRTRMPLRYAPGLYMITSEQIGTAPAWGINFMMGIVKKTAVFGVVLGAGFFWSVPAQAQGIIVGTGMPGVTTSTSSYLALGGSLNPGTYPSYGGYGSYYPPYPYYPFAYDPAGDYLR